ncbi:peptidase family M3-domain-containing protein [Fennellomyces sp. T-0311]|nr:peptidase family M3-domain-containing protein [Fennellomyces sp. T-0311]
MWSPGRCIRSLRQAPLLRVRSTHYRRGVSTLHNVNEKTAPATDSNDFLRLIFDDKNTWDQHRKLYASAAPVGLLGNPHFTDVSGYEYAAKQAIQRAQLIVERIWRAPENGALEMQRVVKNLDRLSDTLCSVIDLAEFLRNAHPGEETMEAANKAYMDLCFYMNTLNTDTRMHKVLAQVLADKSIVEKFTPDEHAAAIVFLRDFEKSGIHLPNKQREQFVELSDRIIQLGREFVQREPRGVDRIRVDPASLNGLGQSVSRSSLDKDGYMHIPTNSHECQVILKYASNENVRRQVYEAVNSANRDSVHILELLMKTRAELANLVGRSSFADLQLQDKMAKSPANVRAFLRTLLNHQAPASERDIQLLQEIKQRAMRLDSPPVINAWDRDYYMHVSEVLERQSQGPAPYMPYFSVGSVMQGLSRLFNHLYGIQFVPGTPHPGELWHDDVRKLDVVCEQEGKIGTIYCDLYSRLGKTTNAAHYTVRTSRRVDDDDSDNDIRFAFPQQNVSESNFLPPIPQTPSTIRGRDGLFQLPVIALTCDFNNTNNGTALLSMFEIETLFHEMGHAMHSMLGRTDFHNVAGTRCATDFVELPSILMEHFIWHPDVIPLLSKDPKSAPSASTIQAYLKQRRRFNGIETNSQILMALLDQEYHSIDASDQTFSSIKAWHSLQDDVGLFPSVPGTMWPVQFGHLFGYGAGYYSYLFDRTLARRIWQKCFLQDPLSRVQGLAFRDKLLKWGGARDPWQCVADVLGEEDAERIASGDEESMRTVGDWGIDV